MNNQVEIKNINKTDDIPKTIKDYYRYRGVDKL